MLRQIWRKFKKNFRNKNREIDPEDIFLDSKNLPGFEEHRFEGRLEKPIGQKTFLATKVFLVLIVTILSSELWLLSIRDGESYAQISENNRLEHTVIFANRGIIYDRNMAELASNVIKEEGRDFADRLYTSTEGLAHVIGYLKYPQADKKGFYYETRYIGREGVELAFENVLEGQNGLKLKETDVHGNVISESVIEKPQDGNPLVLSIDARLTEAFYKGIEALAEERGFAGGAGVIMDVVTGEILALTSYPEYDENLLTAGKDKGAIDALLNNDSKPFLNRAIGGLYAPGSILKPIVALAALNENIISPEKKILSTGSITVPNPYDATKPSIFKDWKAHGYTNMQEAIAVSSDTYFYYIGGGFGDQRGLGISLLDKYFQLFALTEETGIELTGEVAGIIPTPEWKKEKFNGDIWRLGDTYITSIGQFGTQVTPISAARFVAAIANRGKILESSLIKGGESKPVERVIEFDVNEWREIQEGMRKGVTYGTSLGLNVPYVKAAAKTGTAEIGSAKKYVNSWSVGFFPYDNPRYAWAVVMEKGPRANIFGATSVVRHLFDWMSINTPDYFK